MKVGDTVYWLLWDLSVICSGQIIALSAGPTLDECPYQLVIRYNENNFVLRQSDAAYERTFTTIKDAFLYGQQELARRITLANSAMLSLVGSMHKLTETQ